jgi:type IV pilus assembly protein PilC
MKTFFYTAKHRETGETTGGKVEAESKEHAAKSLRAKGYVLTSIREDRKVSEKTSGFSFSFSIGKSVPLKEKMVFARNLSVMISSGLPLSQAVEALAEQTKCKPLKQALSEIRDSVRSGNSLGDSLAKYPHIFNNLFVSMVRVGEVGGSLEEALTIIATQLEKDHALVSKVRGAMLYPAVIVVAMIGVGIVMLTYILPQILGVFEDMEVELPAATKVIIAISDLLRNHAIVVSLGLLGVIFLGYALFKTPSGKRLFSSMLLRMPAIRNIVIKVNCARFARIYSSLLRSGVSVVDALEIIAKTLSNARYRDAILDGGKQVRKGVELSEVVKSYPKLFPVLVYQMFRVGEQTGKSEEVLLKLAIFYEDEVDQITKNLSSIIEPILMLIIGSAVGFFAVAMLQPMYSVLGNI